MLTEQQVNQIEKVCGKEFIYWDIPAFIRQGLTEEELEEAREDHIRLDNPEQERS